MRWSRVRLAPGSPSLGDPCCCNRTFSLRAGCEEAISFYQKAVGAKAGVINRFRDSPDPRIARPEMADKIMHAEIRIGDNVLLVSDGMSSTGQPSFQGFSLSLQVADAEEAEKVFLALSDGAKIQTPLTETFFAPRFAMLTDRFGLGWIIIAQKQQQQ